MYCDVEDFAPVADLCLLNTFYPCFYSVFGERNVCKQIKSVFGEHISCDRILSSTGAKKRTV